MSKNEKNSPKNIESLEPMVLMSASAAEIDPATLGDGTDGNDVLIALRPDQLLEGKGGHDIVIGLAGDNVMKGGEGHDMLIAVRGDNVIDGGEGQDNLVYWNGNRGDYTVVDDPARYDLDYEDVTFEAADGVTLSGWLIKGDSSRVIVQSHFGVQCSRSGYRPHGLLKGYDKDIEFLRQAQYLNQAGYTVLMYDFRNHGNSGEGAVPFITWGEEEGKDVIAAVNFITNHSEYGGAEIGLLSICMGQGASIHAFGRDNGLKQYPNLKTMISVQPMDYGCFVNALGLPKFLARSTGKAIEKKTGRDFNANSWRPFVKDVSIPTLVIQNRNDGYLDEAFVNGFYEDLVVEKEMLWIDIPKKKGAHSRTGQLPMTGWEKTRSRF